jgi:hypothetical protein
MMQRCYQGMETGNCTRMATAKRYAKSGGHDEHNDNYNKQQEMFLIIADEVHFNFRSVHFLDA